MDMIDPMFQVKINSRYMLFFVSKTIVKWIGGRLNDLIRIFSLPVVLFALGVGSSYLQPVSLQRSILDFLYDKHAWAICAIFFCFTMVSGQMWNHMRGPPFLLETQNGGVAIIHKGSNRQFVLETYIVWVLNAAIVIGMILMTEAVQRKEDVRKRTIFSIVGFLLVTVFFSLLLSVFRTKLQGYPYSLLF